MNKLHVLVSVSQQKESGSNFLEVAMVEWLSSWLVGGLGSSLNSGLATSISEIWYVLLSSHDMTWRLLKGCKILKTTQPKPRSYFCIHKVYNIKNAKEFQYFIAPVMEFRGI